MTEFLIKPNKYANTEELLEKIKGCFDGAEVVVTSDRRLLLNPWDVKRITIEVYYEKECEK